MSHHLYVISTFIHIIAACIWLGGMIFLILAFIPGIKNHPDKIDLIASVSLKFRPAGSVVLALLLITGIYQLEIRGVQWTWAYFTGSFFGKVAGLKILVFIGIVLISVFHDYYLGNLAIKAWKLNPEHASTQKLRNISRMMGRIGFLLAVLAAFLGVLMVRGW
ncbi:MAG: hypothetical protein KUL83_07220 [Lentimicrobium sp.]|jgi:uncharacterized membrane protein|nr:hypothetical protein [Lentimicrobium sp.]MDD2526778.1 hypothetical protein [Lentimicrobiaceae bacterium]MDD4596502.1 hypothetical protein [Lentimicrobiaceae bacterium]MDY0024744.1 hypothetical protein [Lentimicrobium sp.]HAH58779.1 hypothetical protein [Bacteroidales bacterium]